MPAKVRFDSTHPIVSIRVNQELKQQLDEIKEMSGKSAGDILREALKVQASSTKEAYKKGITEGQSIYGVSFRCSGCNEKLWVNTPELRNAASEYMERDGWGHVGCVGHPTKIEFLGYEPPRS